MPSPPSPPSPPAPPAPPRRPKAVTFTCKHHPSPPHPPRRDLRYYSDPGRDQLKTEPKKPHDSTDSDLKYYSEPDANNYFEIDYEFLKELRRIARNNCPKCRRKRSRKNDRRGESEKERYRDRSRKERADSKDKQAKYKEKAKVRSARKEIYVFCNGMYHSEMEHCQLCCKICNRSTDTLDSIEDDYSLVSKSYSSEPKRSARPKNRDRTKNSSRERKNSIQSIKSVSFLESSNDESKDEPNYTAKSFTNDLKKFLLKPSTPRLSFKDKFISIKQELEATKKSPKLKAIKGLWKSY